jgi:hypothetical protein
VSVREPLTLDLQRVPRERVDMSPITPSALAQTSAGEVPAIELRAGNRRWRVGDLFDVSGEDTAHVAIRNGCERLTHIGSGMRFGRVSVDGDTGTHAGAAMAGGTLDIRGNAGAFAAAGMQDGVVRCTYYPDSRSGTPGADQYKVKGNIHWVGARRAHAAEVRLYDRLFREPEPGAAHDFLQDLNPASITTAKARLEPALAAAKPGESFQFERHGYFIADPAGGFNRTVTLRDSWKK